MCWWRRETLSNAVGIGSCRAHRPPGVDFGVIMDTEQLSSFQQAPADANYKCGQCGNILSLKKGQLLPPCPRCGYRQFDRTEASAQC